MSDEKLPARYAKPASPAAPIDRIHPPVNDQSLLGRVFSAFVAGLNTHTIQRNTEELKVRTLYAEEFGKLTDASLERDRKLHHYLTHRDDIIRNDHEQHVRQIDKERVQGQLEAEDDQHRLAMAKLRREQELHQAKRTTAQAQWGFDAFQQSLPHRKERLDHLFRSGAADAALDMIAVVQELMQAQGFKEAPEPSRTSALEKVLEMLSLEIETAQANHASVDQLAQLYSFRSRLSALIEAEKNRPG